MLLETSAINIYAEWYFRLSKRLATERTHF